MENEQKSAAWFEERRGKFTASEFYKLMTSGKRNMTPEELAIEKANKGKRTTVDTVFGATALDYINEKVDEVITSGDLNDFGTFAGNKATEWGEYFEPVAREKFTEKTGIIVKQVGFLQIYERLGGSPDGVTDDAIIEIKCPYASKNHTENLFMNDQWDLKANHKEHYIQMQVNMLAAKKEKGYFISFDPRKLQKSLSQKIILVNIDNALMQEINYRYHEAMKIFNQKLELLFNMIEPI